ncbi:MAG: hypothetical protein E7256_06525 [Lachnospiraceae bacterium]|nr:hypothetical protein [Lachnospiraceae bacterium]
MTVSDLLSSGAYTVIARGKDAKITGVYCCDLLSIAMSHMKNGMAWVTVMANRNTLAVAQLADAGCIILAEGTVLDEESAKKAEEENITVLASDKPIFETALAVYEKL